MNNSFKMVREGARDYVETCWMVLTRFYPNDVYIEARGNTSRVYVDSRVNEDVEWHLNRTGL